MCQMMRWSFKLLRTAFYVVYDCLLKGRELPQSAEYLPYTRVKDQLNIDKECILKANRVIDPVKLKDKVLQMLHSEHMGISKTKNLARYYVWWPKIDENIETLVKSCESCQLNRSDPKKTWLTFMAIPCWDVATYSY